MSLSPLSLLSTCHLLVTWPAVFCYAVMLFAWRRNQEQEEIMFDDGQHLFYIEDEWRRLRAERRAAVDLRAVVGGRVNKRRGRRSGVRIRLEKGGIEKQGQGEEERQIDEEEEEGGKSDEEDMGEVEVEVGATVEELPDAADVPDQGVLDKAPTTNQNQKKDQVKRSEDFVSLAFSFQSRHNPVGSPPHSPTQTSTQVYPVPPSVVSIKTESPPPRTLGPIFENYSLHLHPTVVRPTPLPFTPQPSPPIPYAPTAKSPPLPGSYVLRRRPPSSHLPNSVDTTDLYDGPFLVVPNIPAQKRFVAISLPAGSLAPPRIAVDDVVVIPAPRKQKGYGKEGKGSEDGVYIIDRLRGDRVVKAKNGVGWARELLVHWEGWGYEDDTWEPEEELPVEVVDAFDRRVMEWRVGLGGY